ncbi:hypothetical protein HYPSUDRAFT_629134 [Hypholoma sublateritium FD-334 SS-4]|uniref:Uncharacterized protein n=1 Tax=Hypholoma sublateritium (strain FD-334 SS-4) TaxID=945553 RepID=A0A0D2QB99_HYPSF|nr:hypothetical protein HYPSUDRAFT_629134 [Hypholoma sublateritium FD-334 SS-4]
MRGGAVRWCVRGMDARTGAPRAGRAGTPPPHPRCCGPSRTGGYDADDGLSLAHRGGRCQNEGTAAHHVCRWEAPMRRAGVGFHFISARMLSNAMRMRKHTAREGKFFISGRVAWDAVRERTTREGACGCAGQKGGWGPLACVRRGVAWRGVALRGSPGFLGFRVQARHGKLHAPLAACAIRTHARTHTVGRGLGTSATGRQSTQVRAGSRYVTRAARCLLSHRQVVTAVRCPASGSCEQIRSVLGRGSP